VSSGTLNLVQHQPIHSEFYITSSVITQLFTVVYHFRSKCLKSFLVNDTGKLCSEFGQDCFIILSTDSGQMEAGRTGVYVIFLSYDMHCIKQAIMQWYICTLHRRPRSTSSSNGCSVLTTYLQQSTPNNC